MVVEGTVMDFMMWLGDWGWVHASSVSPRAWGLDSEGPCVVAGLCEIPGTMDFVETNSGGPLVVTKGRRYILG